MNVEIFWANALYWNSEHVPIILHMAPLAIEIYLK
jgi:hypothetical protein